MASFAVTPSARRLPDRGRMVDVATDEWRECGDEPFLRVTSWIPDSVSLTSMV